MQPNGHISRLDSVNWKYVSGHSMHSILNSNLLEALSIVLESLVKNNIEIFWMHINCENQMESFGNLRIKQTVFN